MNNRFEKTFTALPEHIDEMGHVNNAVWVQWVQDIATAHWQAVALPDHRDAFVWVVVRHELDYRGNVAAGKSVTAQTWIPGDARGATSVRRVEFRTDSGKVIVSATTTWAMLDRATQRLVRVREDVLAPFR